MLASPSLIQKTDSNETRTPYSDIYKPLQSLPDTDANRSEAGDQQKFISYFNQKERTEDLQIDEQLISYILVKKMIELMPLGRETMPCDWQESFNNTISEQCRLEPFESIRILHDWRKLIHNAESKEKIIAVLRFSKSEILADRLAYLKKLTEDEPEEEPMEIESLRMSALFIMENPQLPCPQITVSYDGLVYLRWNLGNEGVLGMQFLPSTAVRFTAILNHQDPKSQRWSVSDVLQPSDMMKAVAPFTEQLMQS